jgi:hypothetical protein
LVFEGGFFFFPPCFEMSSDLLANRAAISHKASLHFKMYIYFLISHWAEFFYDC